SILEYYLDHIPPSSPPPNSYYWDFANFAIQLFMENPALTWEQFYNQFINTPCQKTKAVVNDPKRQAGLTELMNKSKEGGEKAFMTKADGTPSPIIPGGEHSTDLGDITGYQGYSHNHTPDGIKMLSPPDIYKLFYFIVNQPTGTPVDAAFGEMVGTQVCPNCPGGYEYYNYIIRFNGSFADAQAIKDRNYTKADLEAFKDKFAEFELSLRPKSEYASQNGNFMNTKGLEEVFFNALDKMNIDKNKMILQKVDKNGNVTNVTLGADGKPKDVPCPN
ncbi:hypothetical protein ACM39_05065, partial [Chryseobacterium sp. FH2]|uniref:hypothetical protein n=1 Tax=Chryseobacterium sp. FH2 TaxID=1674291 RepID=UPI00065B0160